jgi:sigma-B regulation protein RsbU (phosphoserine phosphatase)
MFTTAFFGILDPATGELHYVNCGHEAPLLLRAGGSIALLESTGPVIGAARDVEFGLGRARLDRGDTLIAFTDGVLEAIDEAERAFGEERFLALVSRPPVPLGAMLSDVEAALRDHIGGAAQSDDITLLTVRRAPPPPTERPAVPS